MHELTRTINLLIARAFPPSVLRRMIRFSTKPPERVSCSSGDANLPRSRRPRYLLQSSRSESFKPLQYPGSKRTFSDRHKRCNMSASKLTSVRHSRPSTSSPGIRSGGSGGHARSVGAAMPRQDSPLPAFHHPRTCDRVVGTTRARPHLLSRTALPLRFPQGVDHVPVPHFPPKCGPFLCVGISIQLRRCICIDANLPTRRSANIVLRRALDLSGDRALFSFRPPVCEPEKPEII